MFSSFKTTWSLPIQSTCRKKQYWFSNLTWFYGSSCAAAAEHQGSYSGQSFSGNSSSPRVRAPTYRAWLAHPAVSCTTLHSQSWWFEIVHKFNKAFYFPFPPTNCMYKKTKTSNLFFFFWQAVSRHVWVCCISKSDFRSSPASLSRARGQSVGRTAHCSRFCGCPCWLY